MPRRPKYTVDRDWLYHVYVDLNHSIGVIASQIGADCTGEEVTRIIRRLGIPWRGDGRRGCVRVNARATFDLDAARAFYLEDMWNCDQIGALFGVHGCTIRRRLRESGVAIRHHNDTKRGAKARNRIELDAQSVLVAYREKWASKRTVAKQFSVSDRVIDRILQETGEPRKSLSDIRDWIGPKHPCWKNSISDEERNHRRDFNAQAKWRMKIFERDEFQCQKCHDNRGHNLHAHHIEPHYRNKDTRWQLNNGVTLCSECHRLYHRIFGHKRANRMTLAEFLGDDRDAVELFRSSVGMGGQLKGRCRSDISRSQPTCN